jgi:K+-sensing histidine kinase KdpD
LKLRRCSIYELAHDAVDTMGTTAEGAGIQLDLNCHATRDTIYFDADADRILQVLTNLLSNAIKFSPAGSTVSVEIDSDSSSLLLKVVDRGRGIPVDKLEAVFDRFQQVESSDASKKGGTGLGLAICRSIVQQHGGAIWALPNQTGPGTTMWVQLSRAARASEGATAEAAGLPARHGEAGLLRDEGASAAVEVEEQLREYGYEVRGASDGAETLTLSEPHSSALPQGRVDLAAGGLMP